MNSDRTVSHEEFRRDLGRLFLTLEDHLEEIDRDLSAAYISRWPFCVATEDNALGIGFNELEGVLGDEGCYVLTSRPAECLRFSRENAEKLAADWNSDPARPRVRVIGQVRLYEAMREIKQGLLNGLRARGVARG